MLDLVQSPDNPLEALTLLFALVIGHALADYPLQGDYIALNKNRHYRPVNPPPDQPKGLWIHCLLAHSLIHAGFVWVITGRVSLAVAEVVLHFTIDGLKCERKTSLLTDQLLHLTCKVVYVVVIMKGMVQ